VVVKLRKNARPIVLIQHIRKNVLNPAAEINNSRCHPKVKQVLILPHPARCHPLTKTSKIPRPLRLLPHPNNKLNLIFYKFFFGSSWANKINFLINAV
jgi:hypothetical protein